MLSKKSYEELNRLIKKHRCSECNSELVINFMENGVDLICSEDKHHITGNRIVFDETTLPPSPRIVSDIQIVYLVYIIQIFETSSIRDLIGIYLDEKVAKKRTELYLERLMSKSRSEITFTYQIKRIETDIPFLSLVSSMMEFQMEIDEYENSE